MTVGDRIKNLRTSLNLTQIELANAVGVSKQTLYKYENNIISNIPSNCIEDIAKVLKTSPAYLMGWDEQIYQYDDILPFNPEYVPLLGEIACGEPIYSEELRGSYVHLDGDIKADFCLRAKGDSMINARIYEGDIVYVKKQHQVDNGDIAVVLIDDEATLKRVYYYPEASKLLLQPENPSYEPLIYVGEELNSVKILGKAIFFQSNIR